MNAIITLILRILLVILAYAFIGGVGYLIYKDLKSTVHQQELITIPSIIMQVNMDQQTITKRFSQPEIILGRDPSCDLILDNSKISLRHSRVTFHDKHWWVEDLDSTNGSFLNNVSIDTPTVITNGDQLKLGHVLINITENQT